MERIAGRLVVGVLALLLCSCGLVGSPADEERVEGYLLYGDAGQTEVVMGILFVQFVPEGDGRITGRMHSATPFSSPDMPSVFFHTSNIQGSIDGPNILIQEESPGLQGAQGFVYIDYQGTLEGDEMTLTRNAQGQIIWFLAE